MLNLRTPKHVKNKILSLFILIILFAMGSTDSVAQQQSKSKSPFLGWNSYDCYGSYANEQILNENLSIFIEKLKPAGYEYFVVDAGWYRHYDLNPGQKWPSENGKAVYNIDEFGRFLPSQLLFPNGFKAIIDRAHAHGIKFGIHLMRGIPKEVVRRNLPIKGTKYFARDIANTNDTCVWSKLNYGTNTAHPGTQEYYNSVVQLAADWGVDFIKYDDIGHKPNEIEAVVKAIEKCGRNIVLSISPGDDIKPEYVSAYQKADMVRITRDIWDLQEDINITFDLWEKFESHSGQGFWLDMDMIPFGHIKISNPVSNGRAFSNRGYERQDYFTYAQKKTFITQRAMAASPLFMGGALTTSPQIVFELITNHEMLQCNQNGITGKLVTRIHNYGTSLDVWKTPKANSNNREGWIGIFNRNAYLDLIKLDKKQLGLNENQTYVFEDIWGKQSLKDDNSFLFEIPGHDVVFLHYKQND